MSPPLTKIILIILGMMLIARQAESAPIAAAANLTQIIEEFLNKLYGKLERKPDIYEQMQGDQPPMDENETANLTDYVRNMKTRSKDTWIQVLKHNILRQIGRTDTPANATLNFPIANISIPQIYNNSTSSMHLIDADHITEKIRSYYPKCEPPPTLDPELLDSNLMNLYFNFDNLNHDDKFNIVATATLRLYRLVANGTGSAPEGTKQSSDCDSSSAATTSEEERLLRVTIYWYTRSLKKKRIKRKLCDSKMVSENASWVELSVKPATKQWARGRNLGLAVQVEDQEGNILKADKMFKGATCTVGASTPKPIPTIIIDAASDSNKLDGINSLLGRNTTTAVRGHIPMLPSIDICTLEFPDNFTKSDSATFSYLNTYRINACNLKRNYEQAQLQAYRERVERLYRLPKLLQPSNNTRHSNILDSMDHRQSRHIRHQRQHHLLSQFNDDPRSKIENKRILTNEEFQALLLNTTQTIQR